MIAMMLSINNVIGLQDLTLPQCACGSMLSKYEVVIEDSHMTMIPRKRNHSQSQFSQVHIGNLGLYGTIVFNHQGDGQAVDLTKASSYVCWHVRLA